MPMAGTRSKRRQDSQALCCRPSAECRSQRLGKCGCRPIERLDFGRVLIGQITARRKGVLGADRKEIDITPLVGRKLERASGTRIYRPELPILLLLDPLMDVAPDPVVDVPLEPTNGVLGATGALLGAVLPVEVLGGLPPPNGITLGIAVGPDGWTLGRRAVGLPGGTCFFARLCKVAALLHAGTRLSSPHPPFLHWPLAPPLLINRKPRLLGKEQTQKRMSSTWWNSSVARHYRKACDSTNEAPVRFPTHLAIWK
jgi:hypothetical protein